VPQVPQEVSAGCITIYLRDNSIHADADRRLANCECTSFLRGQFDRNDLEGLTDNPGIIHAITCVMYPGIELVRRADVLSHGIHVLFPRGEHDEDLKERLFLAVILIFKAFGHAVKAFDLRTTSHSLVAVT
jgi:hypothetical protein